jgi:prepilin-type N-terminal cleavage/methylation domain-containing protein
MRNTKSAFTLVELIVVITILAILGTIAFISLQGYSADARNSKRISDLGNIQSAITLKQVEGTPVMSFVSDSVASLTSPSIAGAAASTADYQAGTPSYAVLNVDAKDFKDPMADEDYMIGATSLRGGSFQIAASMETEGSANLALVNGNYQARSVVAAGTDNVKSANGKVITLDNAAANSLKVNDNILVGTATGTVTRVARDGITVTLSIAGSDTHISLADNETPGLVKSTGTAPVTNNSTDVPY